MASNFIENRTGWRFRFGEALIGSIVVTRSADNYRVLSHVFNAIVASFVAFASESTCILDREVMQFECRFCAAQSTKQAVSQWRLIATLLSNRRLLRVFSFPSEVHIRNLQFVSDTMHFDVNFRVRASIIFRQFNLMVISCMRAYRVLQSR